jgi:hypothetical protein
MTFRLNFLFELLFRLLHSFLFYESLKYAVIDLCRRVSTGRPPIRLCLVQCLLPLNEERKCCFLDEQKNGLFLD